MESSMEMSVKDSTGLLCELDVVSLWFAFHGSGGAPSYTCCSVDVVDNASVS